MKRTAANGFDGTSPRGPALRQQTLKTSICCYGVGLHSGSRIRMSLNPAPAGHGIEFRRTDRPAAEASVQASHANVVDTRLCTVLANEHGSRVATVEHLMAALFGCGIDNAIVEVSGPELPVMDGSAAPFVFLIECAGIAEQDAPRRAIEVLRPVGLEEGEAAISIRPGSGLSVAFELCYPGTVIDRQVYYHPFRAGSFKAEIARARTFGFLHEVDRLRAAGLAKGGSLENAVVVDGARVLNDDGLRYEDEFVRHKVLDCLGDLFLAGAPVIGAVTAARSGHAMNNRLLHALLGAEGAWRYVDMTAEHLEAPSLPPAAFAGRRRHLRVAAGD